MLVEVNASSSWREEGEGVFIPLSQKLAVTAQRSGTSVTNAELPQGVRNFRKPWQQHTKGFWKRHFGVRTKPKGTLIGYKEQFEHF